MTTRIIRDNNGVIKTGKFCILGSSKSKSSNENIILPDVDFPDALGMASFEIPTLDHRYSINVDGVNISGTSNEIAKILHDDFQIYVTYSEDLDGKYRLMFTNMIEDAEERKIGVKGATPINVPNGYEFGYCEIITVDGVHIFSLRNYFSFAMIPIKQNELDVLGAYRFNYSIYPSPTHSTPLNSDRVIEIPADYEYYDDLMRSLSDEFNNFIGLNATYYSSNVTEFKVNNNQWFDFSNETQNVLFDMIKGYAPIIGMPT